MWQIIMVPLSFCSPEDREFDKNIYFLKIVIINLMVVQIGLACYSTTMWPIGTFLT